MRGKDKRKLYKYRQKQEYKQAKRNIYRDCHFGELDNKLGEFDKKWTSIVLKISLVLLSLILLTISLSGFLKLSDQALIALAALGGLIITEIIAVFLAYKYKSFKGKKEEESNLLEREKLGLVDLKEKLANLVNDVVEDTTGREG